MGKDTEIKCDYVEADGKCKLTFHQGRSLWAGVACTWRQPPPGEDPTQTAKAMMADVNIEKERLEREKRIQAEEVEKQRQEFERLKAEQEAAVEKLKAEQE